MELSVFFAGTAGSAPSARRGLPALLVRRGADRILFDCGEGTQRQLVRSVGLADLHKVFITHLHADHWLGLPGMLKSFELRDRERPLTVYGPPGIAALMKAMRLIYGRLSFPFEVIELAPGDAVAGDEDAIHPFSVAHRGPAYGYALVEAPRPGRFDAELAERLGGAPGPDFGRLQRGEVVAGGRPEQGIGPTRESRKIVISGDTAPCEPAASSATRRGRCSPPRRCRATSTRSRSRSWSAALPSCCAGTRSTRRPIRSTLLPDCYIPARLL